MTEDEIRAHIFKTLARLYDDPLHRSQYKQFVFEQSDKKKAEEILTQLTRNFVVEQLQPWVVRLTDLGYQLIQSDLWKPEGEDSAHKTIDLYKEPPTREEIEKLTNKMGQPDYISASVFTEGQSEIFWATEGFKEVTGYSIEELKSAGGTVVLIRGTNNQKKLEQLAKALANSDEVRDEIEIVTKSGRTRTIHFLVKVRHDSNGRIIGTVTAVKDVTFPR